MNALSIRSKSIVALAACLTLAVFAMPCRAATTDIQKTLETATSGSGQARYTAIDDLGEHHMAAEAVVPALEKILADKDQQARWRAARALGDYRGQAKSAATALTSLLKDTDPIVQYHSAVALGKIEDKSPETVQALVTAATSKDERVARAAIAALRELDADRAEVLKSLGEVLKSDDEAVVLHALEAIVEHDGNAVPLLNEALKQPGTEFLALAAIERLGPEAKATVPTLTEQIGKTKHSKLLIQELLALAAIGPDAASAAPTIIPLLDNKDDKTIPVAAAYALGSIGAKDADAALRDAMKKDNPFLQMVAAWSLAILHPDDQAAKKVAVDKLVQGLGNSDPGIRTAAAKGLQKLQAPPEMAASTARNGWSPACEAHERQGS
jgi:HEAT repeat protein